MAREKYKKELVIQCISTLLTELAFYSLQFLARKILLEACMQPVSSKDFFIKDLEMLTSG